MTRDAFGPTGLATQLARLVPGFPRAKVCVAYSGGADSTVLLHALATLRRRGLALRAVHVDHRLQPASREWAQACRRRTRALGVPLHVLVVDVDIRAGDSLEARAREARYAALAEALRPGESLLTAHHLEDQAETVLLHALRGAGVAGLAAMPERMPFATGLLVRPLLAVPRAQLRQYASRHDLEWIEDPSNDDLRFDRNFLRNEILPRVLQRWPGAAGALSRSARHVAEARGVVLRQARLDAEAAADGCDLVVTSLRALPAERRRQALRYWLALRSKGPMPDSRQLREIAGPLLEARPDANPVVTFASGRVMRFRGRLRFGEPTPRQSTTVLTWSWRSKPTLELGAGRGRLRLRHDPAGPLALARLPDSVFVRTREGGERIRPRIAGPSRSAKALLHSAGLSPEVRAAVPFLYADEATQRLIAIGDRWYDASVQDGDATAERARLVWERASSSSRSTR